MSVDKNYALIKVEASGMFDQFRALKPRFDVNEIQYLNSDSNDYFEGVLSTVPFVSDFAIEVAIYESHLSVNPSSEFEVESATLHISVFEN